MGDYDTFQTIPFCINTSKLDRRCISNYYRDMRNYFQTFRIPSSKAVKSRCKLSFNSQILSIFCFIYFRCFGAFLRILLRRFIVFFTFNNILFEVLSRIRWISFPWRRVIVSNKAISFWQTKGAKCLKYDAIFAKAANEFVCKYRSLVFNSICMNCSNKNQYN